MTEDESANLVSLGLSGIQIVLFRLGDQLGLRSEIKRDRAYLLDIRHFLDLLWSVWQS